VNEKKWVTGLSAKAGAESQADAPVLEAADEKRQANVLIRAELDKTKGIKIWAGLVRRREARAELARCQRALAW
jgi:hypothetical protein